MGKVDADDPNQTHVLMEQICWKKSSHEFQGAN